MQIKITRVGEVPLPAYQTDGAAGMDLSASLESPVILQARSRAKIPTGLKMEIPNGFEGQIRPRSGFAKERGVTVLNAPGTVDSDFRGEVCVLLVNLGNLPVLISPLDRIAQIVFAPVTRVELVEAGALDETDRGEGGFGSTDRAAE